MHPSIDIRPERPEDYSAIAQVNQIAFGQDSEARLIAKLRDQDGFDPNLSLVAIRDGLLVGHILFSPITIVGPDCEKSALALAPMAVRPDCQGTGIGSRLVSHGLEACRRD